MNRFSIALGTSLLAISLGATAAAPANKTDKVSYSIGYKTGQAMHQRSVNVNPDMFSEGLKAGLNGEKPALSNEEMQSALKNMQKEMIAKMKAKLATLAKTNREQGEAFLAKNAKNKEVKTLQSGLQYKVLTAGNGTSPTLNDKVTVNYEGKFINGKVFDSSYKRGKPITFGVKNVIKGWQEALTHMKPGATWMLYIPSKLAYGKHGSFNGIGPNQTLIFKVNLISVKK